MDDLLDALWARWIRLRLMAWLVRWVLGFATIALVVHWKPSLWWLWLVGGSIAGSSLVVVLVWAVLGKRKIRDVQGTSTRIESMVARGPIRPFNGRVDNDPGKLP
jgi:hypothetical protein